MLALRTLYEPPGVPIWIEDLAYPHAIHAKGRTPEYVTTVCQKMIECSLQILDPPVCHLACNATPRFIICGVKPNQGVAHAKGAIGFVIKHGTRAKQSLIPRLGLLDIRYEMENFIHIHNVVHSHSSHFTF